MNPQIDFAAFSRRCAHLDASGRQCRSIVLDPHATLCGRHTAQEARNKEPDVYPYLIRNSQGLQTAQGINFSLSNLYKLLAINRISPRRASVLAYINSLLLRTLPAIDADLAAGITDPTKRVDAPEEVPQEVPEDDAHRESASPPNLPSPPIPEPDPLRKPS